MFKKKLTCLMFGEGKNDKDFVYALAELKKFKDHTPNWHFKYGNAHGGSALDVIRTCKCEKAGTEYDLILCFIDLDDLKNDFKQNWEEKKKKIEEDAFKESIEIIWFLDKLEAECRRVLGDEFKDYQVRREAKKNTQKFINSDLWKRILGRIKERERSLKK